MMLMPLLNAIRQNIILRICRRKYLTVISLEMKPGSVLVRLPYGAKYEISCTQWSPIQNMNLFGVAVSKRTFINLGEP